MLAPVKAGKKTTLILSTDPGALTFEQGIALALLWFSASLNQKQMHIGKTDGPGFTCILAVIAYFYYLLNIYLFIYLFLSLLSSSTVSKKVWSAELRAYHFFSQLPFNCFAASSYYTDQSALGGEEGGRGCMANVSEKVIREFFPSLFNLMVILILFANLNWAWSAWWNDRQVFWGIEHNYIRWRPPWVKSHQETIIFLGRIS